jgi:sulfofructose kinase
MLASVFISELSRQESLKDTLSMSGKPIIVVGHAALDYVYKIDAFPPAPTKLRAIEHVASGGGMAANAAATIARLGRQVVLWSRIGDDDAGQIARQQLNSVGVEISHVRVLTGKRTPTAAVIVDRRGGRLVVSEDDHFLPLEADWLPVADVAACAVVLSDLTWLEGTQAAFRAARAAGIPTLLDVDLGSGQLLARVIGLTDYAIFSAPALRRFIEGDDDEERLQQLIQSGVRHAGVTLGAKGYVWIEHGGGRGTVPAFTIEAVDTTGAGDAFHGAFAWALAEGKYSRDCAEIASAVAALSCRGLGARSGLPTRGELEAFLAAQCA